MNPYESPRPVDVESRKPRQICQLLCSVGCIAIAVDMVVSHPHSVLDRMSWLERLAAMAMTMCMMIGWFGFCAVLSRHRGETQFF